MIRKRSRILVPVMWLIVVYAPGILAQQNFAAPTQAPKKMSIVRNDTDSAITFEFWSGDEWKKITVDAHKDVNVYGLRVRIGTDRQDRATITVELPIEGGKKYLVFWNDPPGMWDFKGTS